MNKNSLIPYGTRLPSCGTTQLGFVEALFHVRHDTCPLGNGRTRRRLRVGRSPISGHPHKGIQSASNMALSLSATRWDPSDISSCSSVIYMQLFRVYIPPGDLSTEFSMRTATKASRHCGLGSHGHAASSVSSLTSASPVVTKERRTYQIAYIFFQAAPQSISHVPEGAFALY